MEKYQRIGKKDKAGKNLIQFRPEPNSGKSLVEKSTGRTIKEMWERLLKTGEIQKMAARATHANMNKKQTVALMNLAREAPPYMKQGEKDEILRKASNLEERITKIKAKKKEDQIKNDLIEEGKRQAREEAAEAARNEPLHGAGGIE